MASRRIALQRSFFVLQSRKFRACGEDVRSVISRHWHFISQLEGGRGGRGGRCMKRVVGEIEVILVAYFSVQDSVEHKNRN